MRMLLPTRHSEVRMAQRGFNLNDVELIMMAGTEVEDGYLMRQADYQEIERVLKKFLKHLSRLRGKRLVVATGRIVTAYHATSGHERKLLRNARAGNSYA